MIPGLCSLFYRRGTKGTFSVVISPTTVGGAGTGPGTVTSSSVTAIASGGTPPYTYSWARYTGDASISADSGTSATTTFSANLGINDSTSAQFVCNVTDSVAATVPSPLVNCSLRTVPH